MKTRNSIYGVEAMDLLRNISMYRTLTENQIYRFYPGKEKVMKNLLAHLVRQGRAYWDKDNGYISARQDENMDKGLRDAVWVLLDFIDTVEYHAVGDFPVKICFFVNGEAYEIIHVPYQQETLVSHAIAIMGEVSSRRIILVDHPNQINKIEIPATAGFCGVSPDGKVQYYKHI